MKTIYLSYYINEQTPLYGGEKAIELVKRSEISKGAGSNTKFLHFPNHLGTHIDFPNHFSDSGKTINDYSPSFWNRLNVFVIDYQAKVGEIIDDVVLQCNIIPANTEFLIINTGFGNRREKKVYWENNPGLDPRLAKIIKKQCPNIKIIGFDFISVSSYQNRLLGREAHREFLLENEILLIEDMKLDEIEGRNIISITALPLMIDNIDGTPITIIAEIN